MLVELIEYWEREKERRTQRETEGHRGILGRERLCKKEKERKMIEMSGYNGSGSVGGIN